MAQKYEVKHEILYDEYFRDLLERMTCVLELLLNQGNDIISTEIISPAQGADFAGVIFYRRLL